MPRSTRRVVVALLVLMLVLPVASALAVRGNAAPAPATHPVAHDVQAGRERLPAWAPPSARRQQRATLTGPARVRRGASAAFTATFAPARTGRPVRLEVRRAGGWATVDTARQTARGRAALDHRPTATTTYRAVAPAWRKLAAVRSKPVTVTVSGSTRKPWVTGYYAAWFWEWLYPPEKVDMKAMTHFVFGRVAPGGGSLGGDPTELMDGAWSAQEPGRAPDGSGDSIEDYLIGRAHAAGTKALLMLGGDGLDGRGFMLSTTDENRPAFVENIADYLVEHDYDGVDLDWENCLNGEAYCGEGEEEDPVPGTEAQRRLQALIADLRVELATRGRYAQVPALITFPGYAVKTNENGGLPAPWQADVANAVDQYNLMTYGIGTTWNGGGWLSWFSGALFGQKGNHPVDISSSVAAYVRAGVPRERIGIGIGFYGIYFGPTITGPRQPTDKNSIYEVQDAPLSYSELDRMGYFTHGTRKWDTTARSTYRVYGKGGYVPKLDPGRNPAGFLSYEDEQSIAAKGEWVRDTGVGGTILWTINYGWLPRTQRNPLLAAVKESFLG